MNFDDAVAELDARTNYERSGRLTVPTLDRMRALMDMLANPERSFAAIHVTGTNGKTTTARAAAALLRAAGLRVGTYTSPHVTSIRERFTYDGRPIEEDEFAHAWDELRPYVQHLDRQGSALTWFEAATALAFAWFTDKAVDVAVIEVGMGGSWDATNVVDARVAALTGVDVDHADVLGSTAEQIAVEKLGIVKQGAVAYVARQSDAVAALVRAHCGAVDAEIRAEGHAFELERVLLAVGGQALSLRLGRDRYDSVYLPLFGEHLARDVVLGFAAARELLGGASLDEKLLTEAMAQIRIPGRMEVARREPLVVLDGAHNPAAAAALARALTDSFSYQRLHLVVGIMGDKDVEGILEHLVPLADDVVVTRSRSPRAAALERLTAAVRAAGGEPTIVPDVSEALGSAIETAGQRDAVLVTGSLYTVGEARRSLIPEERR